MLKKIFILIILFVLVFPAGLNAASLAERLKGGILLQVESRGEAWYVNPENSRRYYLGRPADAFRLMRELGLGASNADFGRWAGRAPARLAGRILLKVEDLGQAYYVRPDNLEMVYLKRPLDAFSLMREQGLGISNSDLSEIVTATGFGYYDPAPELPEEAGEPEETADEGEEEALPEEQEENSEATTTDETATTTDEATATSSASECVFNVEYFDNDKLIGSPAATATVLAIDFDWGLGGPEELDQNDSFSARYIAVCDWEEGRYRFNAVFNDGIKVYLDGTNFLQGWEDRTSSRTIIRDRSIENGEHELKIEYYDHRKEAELRLDWEMVE